MALARHEMPAAEKAFERTLELNEHATGARMHLAEIRLALGDRTHALADARTAAAERPQDPEAAILLSRALRATDDTAGARHALQEAHERINSNAALDTELGWLELAAGNPSAARPAFGRALKTDPASPRARDGIVAADIAARDVDAARARVHAWLAERPNDDQAELLAARIDLARNDPSGAEQRILNILRRTPSRLDAYELLGAVYLKQGRVEAALAKYRELASRDKTADLPLTIAGMILESQGKRAEARVEYEAALARNPRAGVAANNLAWMLAQDGQLDRALSYATTAVDQMRNQPEAYDTLGWVYLRKQLPGHAETAFSRAIDLAPQNDTYKQHLQQAREAAR